LTFNNDGSYDYVPDNGFTGTDTFIYELCDVDSDCDTALVTITVLADLTTALTSPTTELTCTTTTIKLDVSGSMGSGPLDFTWSTGATTPSIDITSIGTYEVTITDPNSGANGIESVTITQDILEPTANINTSSNELTCTIASSNLDASGSTVQGTASYAWSTGASTSRYMFFES